jgi:excisionase family DNA binding protein
MEGRMIDANEASRLCGLSKATIYKLVHRGQLRGFRVLNRTLRFDEADIAALMREVPAIRGERS